TTRTPTSGAGQQKQSRRRVLMPDLSPRGVHVTDPILAVLAAEYPLPVLLARAGKRAGGPDCVAASRAVRRPGAAERWCTAGSGCGYATGVGGSAAVTLAGGVHGFPAALTSFIGRDGPLREVAGLLERYRLVTITGPGGSGKTRLAGQVARKVAGEFAD